jgi:hypothetical protein
MQNDRIKALMAIFGGIIIGALVIVLGETMMHSFFPTPAGLNLSDTSAVTAMMQSAPLQMFIGVLITYIIASFAVGYVTNYLSKNTKYRPALIAGFALMVMGILNMTSLWHPTWFWVVSIPCFMIFAFLGGRTYR